MSGLLERLRSTFTNNRAALGALGAVAVAGLAWRARATKKPASSSTSSDGAGGAQPVTGYYSTGSQTGAATGYDSSASDVYNAIQPQLEDIRKMLTGGGTTPIPVPVPDPPESQGYYRKTGTAAVYEALSDGTRRWIDLPTYNARGNPQVREVPSNDPMWTTRSVVGTDAPTGQR